MTNTPNGFLREDPWRSFRIMAGFVDAFEALSAAGPAVTIFSSARTPPLGRCRKTAIRLILDSRPRADGMPSVARTIA